MQAVAPLPRDELASLAEALVNLTSFRQRVSVAYETVGGPIDVAAEALRQIAAWQRGSER